MRKSINIFKLSIFLLIVGVIFPVIAKRHYVNIFWNQHQPSYINPITGVFDYPFVRTHALRDYYFMAAVLIHGRNPFNTYELRGNEWVDTGHPTGHGFPFVHITINISGTLLEQIQYYVDSLAPCFDGANSPQECDFSKYPNGNPLDPNWKDNSVLFERVLDLLLKPQENFTGEEKVFILFYLPYQLPLKHHIYAYPSYYYLEYKRLYEPGGGNPDNWTTEELRDYKVWYALSSFHYYFKETDRYPLVGLDENGNEIRDYVENIKTLGRFKTWGTPDEEWFGAHGETLDPNDIGGYSNGSGEEFIEKDGTLCRHFTDEDAIFIAIQMYKILKFIIPIHRKLMAVKCPHDGYPQLEVVTTPFSHPILPLIYDTDNYFENSPYNPRVDAIDYNFHGDGEAAEGEFGPDDPVVYDDDVYNQVALGAKQYYDTFGKYPDGMWPGEGAVGETVIYAFRRNNVKWIASGNEVCTNSGHSVGPDRVYRIDEDDVFLDGDNSDAMSIVFRSGGDIISFNGGYYSCDNFGCDADSWARRVMDDIIGKDYDLWTHLADGENAWGWFHRFGATFFEYTHLPDGSESYGLYYRLNRANYMIPENERWYKEEDIVTVTPSSAIGIKDGEYVEGAPFPLDEQYEIEPLSHGSWVYGNFDTWMGEDNEIQGWIDLKQTRVDMESIGASQWRPHPYEAPPTLEKDGREAYFKYKMWLELYRAQSSDTFWWYGADQCFGSDEIFDDIFRERLVNIYVYAQKAGYDMPYPYMQVHPIISPGDNVNNHHPIGPGVNPDCPQGWASCDEDYLYDCEDPPGHGHMIKVPPLTRYPALSLSEVPNDGKTATVLSIKVFEEKIERSQISEVYVDLRPIGGEMKHYLYDDGDIIRHGDLEANDQFYSCIIKVPESVSPGRYMLTIYAWDDTEAFSRDYIFINVVQSEHPSYQPKILLAGFENSYITNQSGGTLIVSAIIDDKSDGENIGKVSLYYRGEPDNPIEPPIYLMELGKINDKYYRSQIDLPGGLNLEQVYFLIKVENKEGQVTDIWPTFNSE